ncbi:ANTH-domain-containing protein, partial [Aureobasidium melanogenum]|uniref:ANTH-domain-containing protein n=1 Tax=Aureobasidium melanogenum (strain CBS 110374) TaxID=1043003 RepID=A0A074VEW6_AURM1
MSSSVEKSVKGGTKVKLAPPKSKYVEHILLATSGGEAGVAEIFRTLKERLRDTTWTICFKALIIVHLMIKEGERDATLKYLAAAPKNRLAINSYTDVQTQGQNIRRYNNYLIQRAESFADTHVDHIRNPGRMKNLSIAKGLLRETEAIQDQIRVLIKCDPLENEPENDISLMAFRLLTKDLLDLFTAMNEAVMNILSHYFELSKPDAEHAIGIYKTFAKQTDQVVQYLSIARQYEHITKLEIPKIKHAPTSLANSLQEYIDDHDFETNRRQYLAEQQAKSGKPIKSSRSVTFAEAEPKQEKAAPAASQPPSKGPAPDLIDFFGSIEEQQQPMAQASTQQYAQPTGQPFPQMYGQPTADPGFQTAQSTNPFGVPQNSQFMAPPTAQLQPQFTGAGFGGYGPQPQQQVQPQQTGFSSNPFQSTVQQPFQSPPPQQQQPQQTFMSQDPFSMQQQQQDAFAMQQQQPQMQSPPQPVQPQATNPFRQSMMPTGQMNGLMQSQQTAQPQQRQSSNPFARQAPQQDSMQTGFQQQQQPLQAQPTGTNPFAKPSPQTSQPTGQSPSFLTPAVTGSTNPFRQSMFVNQQTGQGWQNTPQASMGGWEQLETVPVFPRPGQ